MRAEMHHFCIPASQFFLPSLYVLNELCGIATDDSARGDVLGDYGSCGNDGILSDGHAWQDNGTHANPGIAADVDGFTAQHHSVLEVVVVGDTKFRRFTFRGIETAISPAISSRSGRNGRPFRSASGRPPRSGSSTGR